VADECSCSNDKSKTKSITSLVLHPDPGNRLYSPSAAPGATNDNGTPDLLCKRLGGMQYPDEEGWTM
jgi:hypothetical protein